MVVVIIGILIAIAIPLYLNYKKGANDKAAQSDLRGAISALEQCNADSGFYPAATTGSDAITATPYTVCTGQQITLSTGTTLSYYATGTSPDAYTMLSINGGGNANHYYCYDSANGGSVKAVSSKSATAC